MGLAISIERESATIRRRLIRMKDVQVFFDSKLNRRKYINFPFNCRSRIFGNTLFWCGGRVRFDVQNQNKFHMFVPRFAERTNDKLLLNLLQRNAKNSANVWPISILMDLDFRHHTRFLDFGWAVQFFASKIVNSTEIYFHRQIISYF